MSFPFSIVNEAAIETAPPRAVPSTEYQPKLKLIEQLPDFPAAPEPPALRLLRQITQDKAPVVRIDAEGQALATCQQQLRLAARRLHIKLTFRRDDEATFLMKWEWRWKTT